MTRHPELETLLRAVRPARERVAAHPVFASLETLEDLRTFMEHHVFAVWDFMSLVKALQAALTCGEVPWIPRGEVVSRRLINEIVLDEESDEDGRGGYASHFELYLASMDDCGADAGPIRDFVARLARGEGVREALVACGAPAPARRFVERTWEVVETRAPHRVAAAFAIGREEIVPEMFQAMVGRIRSLFPERTERFGYYLKRHIDVDTDRHGPMSARMLAALCPTPGHWAEATEAARAALEARAALWDAVAPLLSVRRPVGAR